MTAHLQVPALDPSNEPATLSPTILQGVLRDELGFDGVIVTDALNMQGVRTKYGDDRVPVLALKAGADQLLFPPDIDVAYNGASWRQVRWRRDHRGPALRRVGPAHPADQGQGRPARRQPLRLPKVVDRVVGARRHRLAAAGSPSAPPPCWSTRTRRSTCRAGQRKLLVVGASPAFPTDDTRTTVPELAKAFDELGCRTTHSPPGRRPTRRRSTRPWPPRGDGTRWWSPPTTSAPPAPSAPWCPGCSRRRPHRPPRGAQPLRHRPPRRRPGLTGLLPLDRGRTGRRARVIAGRVEPRGKLPVPIQRADDPAEILFRPGTGCRTATTPPRPPTARRPGSPPVRRPPSAERRGRSRCPS